MSAATVATKPPASLRVAILMGAYNGAAHLREQLDSIAAQTHPDWVLRVSDDGSSDATLAILADFAARFEPGRVEVRPGPRAGFIRNFLSLACVPGAEADYYAFVDQDDVWETRKLEVALERLHGSEGPALYCSRTRYIDEQGGETGASPLFAQTPCFRNAIVQSVAGGNTMVFDEAARALLVRAGAEVAVASHDWWLYLLVSGHGGRVVYDSWMSVRYRQHGTNLVGGNVGTRARLERMAQLWHGRFARWNAMHCESLARNLDVLTPENRAVFEHFRASREGGVLRRLREIVRSGAFRQTRLGHLGLYAAVVLNKF